MTRRTLFRFLLVSPLAALKGLVRPTSPSSSIAAQYYESWKLEALKKNFVFTRTTKTLPLETGNTIGFYRFSNLIAPSPETIALSDKLAEGLGPRMCDIFGPNADSTNSQPLDS